MKHQRNRCWRSRGAPGVEQKGVLGIVRVRVTAKLECHNCLAKTTAAERSRILAFMNVTIIASNHRKVVVVIARLSRSRRKLPHKESLAAFCRADPLSLASELSCWTASTGLLGLFVLPDFTIPKHNIPSASTTYLRHQTDMQ